MSFENEFIIDIMEPTLQARSVTISRRKQEYAFPTSIEASSWN
jgi:hypothetical protein